jgi:hypothetical protein
LINISEHLEQNNGYIKVKWDDSEGIIIENINFNDEVIYFKDNYESNYNYIEPNNNQVNISKIQGITFNNCNFKELMFCDIRYNQYTDDIKLFYFKINGGVISDFTIENIHITSKFYINKEPNDYEPLKIKKLKINNSKFEENFKMHNCIIDEITIQDTDFKKQFDFYKSTFKSGIKNDKDDKTTEIDFNGLNITELSIFDNTTFEEKMVFSYISFADSINFRNATFIKGFDLDRINLKNGSNINFYNLQGLDTSKSIENTSQETYRMIKYHLDSIGNKIDANKYHSLELAKNRKTIWMNEGVSRDLLQRGIISFIHWLTSNHSLYWFVSLCWIFVIGIITPFALNNDINYNSIFQYMTIWSSIDDFCDNHIVYLLNKVSLGYLYYQLVTAIRIDTRK